MCARVCVHTDVCLFVYIYTGRNRVSEIHKGTEEHRNIGN